MILDFLVVGAITFAAILGALAGALSQVARFVAALGSWLLGGFVGRWLAVHVAEALGASEQAVAPFTVGLSFVGLYLLLSMLGKAVARNLTEEHEVRSVDRATGALLGAAQAAILLWVGLSLLVAIERPLGLRIAERSFAAELAREYGVLDVVEKARA